jgi:quinoprotein glucose dehydrogenase
VSGPVARAFWSLLVISIIIAQGCARPNHRLDPSIAEAGAIEWKSYGYDPGGTRYSPLRQLTRENVQRLQVAWTYRTGEADPRFATRRDTSFEATPIIADGTMYLSTPLGRVIALDPATGEERWVYDPKVDRNLEFGDFTNRGVATWTDPQASAGMPCQRRIFIATIDARLIALNAANGQPCSNFGSQSGIDLRVGLRNPPFETEEYEVTSPPAIVNGLVIVGSAIADNNRINAASGEVRAFDARTGALRWKWDPVPQRQEDPAYGSWRGPRAHETGAANAWSIIAADADRDLVFVPTGAPSPDYYGGERLGENRYANSIVALRASSGDVVWHFQTVHHDLWDYDNASPPVLVTLRHGGRQIPAVLQATKTGMMFVLHRETGAPIFPIKERPVPRSNVSGEEAWPTQPFTALTPPLSPHHFTLSDAWGATAADRENCVSQMRPLRNEGIFTPPSLEGTLVVPSNIGGAHWGGVAVDPERQVAVVPVNRGAAMVQLIPAHAFEPAKVRAEGERLGDQYTRMRGTPFVMRRRILRSPSGLPCTPPPFGTLVAVNLQTGERMWEVPLGTMRGTTGEGASGTPAEWGSPNLGGPIVTAGGLAFVAATLDRSIRGFDVETGRELWRAELPAGGKATPMTYRLSQTGRQYVVIAAGGGGLFGKGDSVVAFALPGPLK